MATSPRRGVFRGIPLLPYGRLHGMFGMTEPEGTWGYDPNAQVLDIEVTEARDLQDLVVENLVLRSWYGHIAGELAQLRERVHRLEETAPEVKVVVLREISRDEAKKEIAELFASGEALDFEQIVERLGIDLELVVDICNELMEAGEIGPDA